MFNKPCLVRNLECSYFLFQVELEFRVPFLNIPVKKAAETMAGWGQGVYGLPPKANVNIPALVLGGAVIFGAAVALPAITTLFTKKTTFFTGIGTMQGERIGHEKSNIFKNSLFSFEHSPTKVYCRELYEFKSSKVLFRFKYSVYLTDRGS